MINKKTWFTLVELIVVITILAILATVGFLSFQWYSAHSRDSLRLSDVKNIQNWLHIYQSKKSQLPIPDYPVNITASWNLINYQWYVAENILSKLSIHWWVRDPLTNDYYTYSINEQKDKYQLLSFLEQDRYAYLHSFIFTNNFNKHPKSIWYSLGVIMKSDNLEPIDHDLDILETVNNNFIYINWSKRIQFTNENKKYLAFPKKSCKNIMESWNGDIDGIYKISYKDYDLNVYCDMTSVGWGWTLFYANNWNPDSEIKKSYTQMRNEVLGKDNFIYDLSDYDNENLAWVLDYSIFSQNWANEILVTNRDYFKSENKWLLTEFDSGSTLDWALSNEVLGTWYPELWHCIEIPNSWTISMTYYNGNNSLNNRFILNQWWQVIGISRESHNCNWYTQDVFQYAMFYTASSNWNEYRTRYSWWVWWDWRIDNQYRYFIR